MKKITLNGLKSKTIKTETKNTLANFKTYVLST